MPKKPSAAIVKLARLVGRDDLSPDQLRKLEKPIAFLFARLAAGAFGEVSDYELFQSPTLRTREYYSVEGVSLASRLGPSGRSVFLEGKRAPKLSHLPPVFDKCFATIVPLCDKDECKAVFVWGPEVFEPPGASEEPTEREYEVHRLALQLMRGVKEEGISTTWWQLQAQLPAVLSEGSGWISPSGGGFVRSNRRPKDRPCLSWQDARMLTAFFYDEPLKQSYSKALWLLVGPRRIVGIFNGPTPRKEEWLHVDHDHGERRQREEAEAKKQKVKRARAFKQSYQKLRKQVGRKGKPKPRDRKKGRRSNHVNMATLNKILSGIITLKDQLPPLDRKAPKQARHAKGRRDAK